MKYFETTHGHKSQKNLSMKIYTLSPRREVGVVSQIVDKNIWIGITLPSKLIYLAHFRNKSPRTIEVNNKRTIIK